MAKVERGHFRGFLDAPGGTWTTMSIRRPVAFGRPLRSSGSPLFWTTWNPSSLSVSSTMRAYVRLLHLPVNLERQQELTLQTEEISEAAWFRPEDAFHQAVSYLTVKRSEVCCIIRPNC